MRHYLKRLLGIDESSSPHSIDVSNRTTTNIRKPIETIDSSNKYFETMSKLQEAISNRNYEKAARFTRENIRQISAFVHKTKQEHGSFIISSIPALENGGTMFALNGDEEGLKEMQKIVSSHPALKPWNSTVTRHIENLQLFKSILSAIEKNPRCLQTDVKKLIGMQDGSRVANLISWLEKAGKVIRIKKGRTYELTIHVHTHSTKSLPMTRIKSHITEPIKCKEIDIQSLPFIPLPRSPNRWDELKGKNKSKTIVSPSQWFEITDSAGWTLISIEKLAQNERPDPAFRRIYPIDKGLILVDDLGNSNRSGSKPAAAALFGHEGDLLIDTPFHHDIYRIGVNTLGRGLIAMSRGCIAHAYDDSFKCILETSLFDSPEVKTLKKRLEIQDNILKNHLRCVALSYDNSRYLCTGVDEAWCMNINGKGLWGVKLPIKEGWSRIAEPSNIFGTSDYITHALEFMNLKLPYATEDLKERYRQLAKQWHPDLNPDRLDAHDKMKTLNNAMELLTGIDSHNIPTFTNAKFMKNMGGQEIYIGDKKITISVGLQVGEVHAADWIYAASFSGHSHDVFLAGYSGKIIQVDEKGNPIKAYDIGAVPRQIVDTGDFLYILTDTRLYILKDDALVSLVDTSESGNLFVAQTGFGLLQKKCFQWFREDGTHLGTVVTKNPIRRVYYNPKGMVVETRQRKAIVGGVKSWWK